MIRVDRVLNQGISLRNLRTSHFQENLGFDNIAEFRNPDFLILKRQITLQGDALHLEPIIHEIHFCLKLNYKQQ